MDNLEVEAPRLKYRCIMSCNQELRLHVGISKVQYERILKKAMLCCDEVAEAKRAVPNLDDDEMSVGICILQTLYFLKHGSTKIISGAPFCTSMLAATDILNVGMALLTNVLGKPELNGELMTSAEIEASIRRNRDLWPLTTYWRANKDGKGALQGCIGATHIIYVGDVPDKFGEKFMLICDARGKILSNSLGHMTMDNNELLMQTPLFKEILQRNAPKAHLAPLTVNCLRSGCGEKLNTFVLTDGRLHEALSEPHLYVPDRKYFEPVNVDMELGKVRVTNFAVEDLLMTESVTTNLVDQFNSLYNPAPDRTFEEWQQITKMIVLLHNAARGHFLNDDACPKEGPCFECDEPKYRVGPETFNYQATSGPTFGPVKCFASHYWQGDFTIDIDFRVLR